MDKNQEYARACTEVLKILEDAPAEDIAKIPQDLMEAMRTHKDTEYEFDASQYNPITGEGISEAAKVILRHLMIEHIMKPAQATAKQEVEVSNEEIKEEPEKIEEISKIEEVNQVEEKVEQVQKVESEQKFKPTTETALVFVKQPSFYQRFINFLKRIFGLGKKKFNWFKI